MFDKIDNDIKIYETDNFIAFVPNRPHISREDGGHIVIGSSKKFCSSRLDLSPSEAKEVMRITMLVSDAMIRGMKKRGLDIVLINYQENGNWSYLKGRKPRFHIHLYGRVKNSIIQPFGEALKFPNPDSKFYNNFVSFDKEDIEKIKKELALLEHDDKYNVSNW